MKKLLFAIFLFLFKAGTAFTQNCQAFVWPTDWSNGATTLVANDSASADVAGYLWSNGETTQSITVTDPGNYCCTVTYTDGCVASSCYSLPDPCWVTSWWYYINNNEAYIVSWAGPSYMESTYLWSNGATTSGFTITSGGQYCVTVTKENGCTATSCIDVPPFSNDSCSVQIQTWYWPDSTVQLHAYGSSTDAVYQWNTGENTQDITVTLPGYYCVTMTNANGCTASDCYLFGDTTCYVYVSPQWVDSSTISLTAIGNNSSGIVYQWSTGATTASITVTDPGSYCVTTTNAIGCTASDCYELANSNYLAVWVQIPDSLNGVDAEIFLIQYDTTQGGTLTAIDTAVTGTGYYFFENVPAGQYLVKAALRPSSPYYNEYLPTYFGQSLFWDDATPVNILPYSPLTYGSTAWIYLVEGQNPGGPGFIGGLVSEGANFTASGDQARGEGDPMAGVQIILRKSDDTPVAATRTATDGTFGFNGLAWGTYRVSVDIPGITPLHQLVTIGPDQPSADALNFAVNGLSASGATDPHNTPALVARPNPVKDVLVVDLPAGYTELTLANSQGQLIERYAERGTQARLNVHSLPEGLYFLTLQFDNQSITTKIIKQ